MSTTRPFDSLRSLRARSRAFLIGLLLSASIMTPAAIAQTPARPAEPDVPVEAPSAPQTAPAPSPPTQPDTQHRVSRTMLRIAQDYTLAAGEEVREIHSFLGDVTINGRVQWNVLTVVGSVRLGPSAEIGGSLVVIGGSATVEEGARVMHDLVVIGGTLTAPPEFSPHGEHVVIGTTWLGDSLRGVLPWITRGLLWGRPIVPDLAWVWAIVGIFTLVYLALNTVFDRAVSATADVLGERPLSVFVTGLLVLLLTVPVLAIIAATLIGLAVIPFLLCAIVIVALVGKTAVARALGRAVLRPELPEGRLAAAAAFILGSVLVTLVYLVPVLGIVTWALTTVLGLGAASSTFRAYLRRERQTAAPAAELAFEASAGDVHPLGPSLPMPAAPPLAEAPHTPAPEPPPAFTHGLAAYPRATFLDRVAAFALDAVLVAIVNALSDMSRYEGMYFLLLLGYHIAFWAWRGTTLGGIICSLRVVRTDGTEIRAADALVRGLSSVFSIAALGIGCFWMLQDPERQMWHDKIAGTVVVRVPRHLVLP